MFVFAHGSESMIMTRLLNHPASGKAGIATRLHIERPWPGASESDRSA